MKHIEEIEFSIITATYNADQDLETLIKSVISQSYKNYEFIIVDGGSKDNTLDIIKKYNYHISHWISEPDKGIYDAWNKGIQRAKGKWILFVGADDSLVPDALEKYSKFIKENKNSSIDYISAKSSYIQKDGTFIKEIGQACTWSMMQKRMIAAHVGSLHNKNLFKEVGLYSLKYKIAGDYELLLRKKDKLNSLFLDSEITKMSIGGVSFSLAAIKEAYQIRKDHMTLPKVSNFLYYIRDILAFYKFKLTHSSIKN